MREIELKGVLPDQDDAVRRLEAASARLIFAGRLEDRRFDTPGRALQLRDHVLRMRTERSPAESAARLDWKGETSSAGGYKEREELSTRVDDGAAMTEMLGRLGYEVTREIDREVRLYEIDGAVVRLERFARMDALVEVEGSPHAIERAIAVLGLRRESFSADRLSDFVRRYEERLQQRAAVSDREAAGDYRYADHV